MERNDSQIWEKRIIQGQTAIMWLYGGGGVLVVLFISLALIYNADFVSSSVGFLLLLLLANYLNKITVTAIFFKEYMYLRTVFSKRKILYSELSKLEYNDDRNSLGDVAKFHLKESNFFKPRVITLCLNQKQFVSFTEWLFEETEFPQPMIRKGRFIQR